MSRGNANYPKVIAPFGRVKASRRPSKIDVALRVGLNVSHQLGHQQPPARERERETAIRTGKTFRLRAQAIQLGGYSHRFGHESAVAAKAPDAPFARRGE